MNPTVTLVGNVVRAPELRSLGSGDQIATLTVVTKDRVKDSGGYTDKNPTFWKVTVWRRQAQHLIESDLHTGQEVIVTGKVHVSEWQDKDGAKRSTLEVSAYSVGLSFEWDALTASRVGEPTGDPFTSEQGDDSPPF